MVNRPSTARTIILISCGLLNLALVSGATAQPLTKTGGRVFGLVGGSFGDGESAPFVGGGAGLRLTRHLGVDFEILHVNDMDLSDENFYIQERRRLQALIGPFEFTHTGNATAFLTKLTAEFPVADDRLIPFVSGGGGVARLWERVGYRCGNICPLLLDRPVAINFSPLIFPYPEAEQAETGLALTVGGGLDIRLWRGLAVGADVSWVRLLLDRRELDFAHVGGRVSYRF